MTPQQTAEQLIAKYSIYSSTSIDREIRKAKLGAIMCVDEQKQLIKEMYSSIYKNDMNFPATQKYLSKIKYLDKVKEIIENEYLEYDRRASTRIF